jgi:trigger factor
MKDEATKALFVGAKKGDVITFNPLKSFENETEVASLLKISKDDVKDVTADFSITIESITRYNESEIDQELFDKVYGEGVVSSEEEFKAKIVENIRENLSQDSDYKFGMDTKDVLVKKYDSLQFPDTFLKRWLLATNKNLTEETLETDYPKMIADLKWQLIKDKIAKANNSKIENEDVLDYARKIARAQFAQYGMIGMGDDILDNYAKDILKKEETVKNIIEKVAENKVLDIVKNAVKLDVKEVTIDEFNKLFE